MSNSNALQFLVDKTETVRTLKLKKTEFQGLGHEIEIVSDNVSVIKEVVFGEYQIQQLSNLSINISKNQVLQSVAKPILREIAIRINVDLNNLKGNEKNTRSLGSDVIQRISQMEKER